MAESKADREEEIREHIHVILYNDWNPLGVSGFGPDDKFSAYNDEVFKILTGSRSQEALIAFLQEAESDICSLDIPAQARLQSVAQKLLSLDVSL